MLLIENALKYVADGLPVLPLCWPDQQGNCGCGRNHLDRAIGKVPLTQNGSTDAALSVSKATEYWTRYPKANIGIAIPPGLFVLDVDVEHNGFESLARMERELDFDLLPTWLVTTGSGGHHYYYKTGKPIRNTARLAGYEGLDIRGIGGYCFTAGHRIIVKPIQQTLPYLKQYTHNKLIDISKLKVGDILPAYDESTGKIVNTTVTEINQRTVNETYIIKFGARKGALQLTGEHPLYTTKGWKQAKYIKVGDELFNLTLEDLNLPRPLHHFAKGGFPHKQKPDYKETYKQVIPSHRHRKSGYEKFIVSVAQELNIPLVFVGNGELVISSGGFRLQPDFIIEGTNKLIEASIDWHRKNLNNAPQTALRRMSNENRHQLYRNAGFELLFINTTEWGSGYNEQTLTLINELRKLLREYYGNGLKVDFIHKLIEQTPVFNIHCEPYHNFFVRRLNKGGEFILAHNCVAPPSLHRLGHRYETSPVWDGEITMAPAQLIELCLKPTITGTPSQKDGTTYLEGQRNDALTRDAGAMRRRGLSEEAIYAALQVTNQQRCQPPLPDNDIRTISKSVSRYTPQPRQETKISRQGIYIE